MTPPNPPALDALLVRLAEAATATGLAAEEFRVVWKRNAAGELVAGLLVVPTARGFSTISIP